ncbi:TetR/AcrR family transcriptional regulator [Niabella beijingensis]|uniref:TetR/AcrR family transcriptional regulator n=1 Tax=Niabella beijingensis TaxID=2872700 RepID=UPI001CBFBE65|nr:TetR/AcrR family transcriptional regulator [Niabella beijingensis]MBZ4189464.1 TetR/AcrR family transcriptional regulator [Niabella beijingensis]
MTLSVSKSERTRRFIIERTAPVFNTKGYAGTSLTDLTHVTGLTKGGLYGNFENKDAIAVAAFDYNFGKVTAYLKDKINAKDNAVERLLTYPEVYRNFLRIPFLKSGCPILNTASEADDTHPQLKEKAAAALAFWKQAVKNQVKRGIGRKEIRPDVHPVQTAVVLMALVEGAVLQAKTTGRTAELHMAMDFLEKFIKGLAV